MACMRSGVRSPSAPPSFDAPKNLLGYTGKVFWLAQDVVSKALDYAQAAPNHNNTGYVVCIYTKMCRQHALHRR